MEHENLNEHQQAYEADFKYDKENLATLDWYSTRMCRDIRAQKYKTILSLGIGHRVVSQNIEQELNHCLEKHIILEGASEIISNYKSRYGTRPEVEIIHTYFEEFTTEERYDAVEAGFVLEHVDDPSFLLKHIKKYLKPGGKLYLAVPNAKSLQSP